MWTLAAPVTDAERLRSCVGTITIISNRWKWSFYADPVIGLNTGARGWALSDRELTEQDFEKFNDLRTGTMFDIIHGIETMFPGWDDSDKMTMMMMVIKAIAIEFGVVDDDDAGEADQDPGTRQ